ncbi:zonular occludens toxin domain-containing protein [Thaumasiovibrio subtropicus]|uniref:zonular occludens toxin domain-containing protein n=1 Tax=Thaumasiovibrio subtropicus TaxID=1891207 RepID=UPI000B361C26|nr:zonular occludens toxin domain-containing protein [Thaumasiovibrio subtropicus]
MLNLIVGRPGGGKSYEAVKTHVIPAIETGRMVITNLPLEVDQFCAVYGEQCRYLIKIVETNYDQYGNRDRAFSAPEHYQSDWRDSHGRAPLIVVDECHMVLPRQGADVKTLEFLSMHRHHGYDITFITQSHKKLHRDVCDMVQNCYRCQKASALGADNRYVYKVQDGVTGAVVKEEIRKYEKRYFKFYKSHTASKGSVNEQGSSDITPIWKKWYVLAPAVLLPITLYFAASSMSSILNKGTEEKVKDESFETNQIEEIEINTIEQLSSSIENPESITEPTQENNKEHSESSKKHPLSEFRIYTKGYISQAVKFESVETYDPSLNYTKVYYSMYSSGNEQFQLTKKAIEKMGYTVTVYDECVSKLTYENEEIYAFCRRDVYKSDDSGFITLDDAMPI